MSTTGPLPLIVSDTLATVGSALIDNAFRFTCREAEAITSLYEADGQVFTAGAFLAAHAEGDEVGDAHYPEAV